MGNPCEFELTGYSRSKPPAPPQNARGPIELMYINQYVTLVFRDAHADTGKRRRRGGEWLRDLPLRAEDPRTWLLRTFALASPMSCSAEERVKKSVFSVFGRVRRPLA